MKKRTAMKTGAFILILILSFAQTIPAKRRKRRKKNKEVPETIIKKEISTKQSSRIDTIVQDILPPDPVTIPMVEWAQKQFMLLEKTRMFQKFGYELYSSPNFSKETKPANPAIAHKNHRLKYDVFKGTVITATKVTKQKNGTYHITFKTKTDGKLIYGKTKNNIIEGLALYLDFQNAKKRWKGKTIYAKRRCIETYDSINSRFTSIKVSATEPLKVKDIRWGITPLPPKFLWLIVERRDSSQGIIPINYSFTNVLVKNTTTIFPWNDDIYEKDPRKLYSWDEYVWNTIDKHNIFTGMSQKQVSFSWGEPHKKTTSKDKKGKNITTCTYDGNILTFKNGVLVKTQNH